MTKVIGAVCVIALAAIGWFWFQDTSAEARPIATQEGRVDPESGAVAKVELEQVEFPVQRVVAEGQLGGEAAAVNATPVRGTIRYESTQEGVPYYSFALRAGNRIESLRTDRYGRYQSREKYSLAVEFLLEGGSLADKSQNGVRTAASAAVAPMVSAPLVGGFERNVSKVVAKSEARSLNRESLEDALDVSVALGPTYFLELSFPIGYGPEQFSAARSSRVNLERARSHERISMHSDPVLWVRCSPGNQPESNGLDEFLTVTSTDGRYGGFGSLPYGEGAQDVLVPIGLEKFATLAGFVSDEQGAPVSGVWVGLQRGERDRSARTNADGAFQFELLEPGAHVVYVDDTHYHPWRTSVVLATGEDANVDFVLSKRGPGGDIRGRITSATGTFEGRIVLFLEGVADQDVWRRADPEWKPEDGRLVADFAFRDLGSGSYRLRCCTIDAVQVESRELTVSPPDTALHFYVEDDLPTLTHTLDVIDAKTRLPIEAYRVYFQVAGSVEELDHGSNEEPWTREISEGVPFLWRVFADGYQANGGTRNRFDADGRLRLELEPGFSAIVNLLSVESMRSLEGVEVFADEVSVGHTDAQGFLFLDLPTRPTRISFDRNLWSVHTDGAFRSDIDGSTGEFTMPGDGVFVSAYLQPMR